MLSKQTVAYVFVALALCDVMASFALAHTDDVTQSRSELRRQRKERRRERLRRLRAHRRHEERDDTDVTSQHDFSDFNPFDVQPEVTSSQEAQKERARLRKAKEARER